MNASTVLMSGVGAPARTAIPIADRARSTRLPATTLPSLMNPSSAVSAMTRTSTGSPRCSRFWTESGPVLVVAPITMRCLVARSNTGVSSISAAVKAPEVMTLISSAYPMPAQKRNDEVSAAVRETFDIVLIDDVPHLAPSPATKCHNLRC